MDQPAQQQTRSVVTRFWQVKTLAQMSPQEWESLCDGCGKCCLHKLMDEDDGEVYYTDVACRYLDLKNLRCRDYANRTAKVEGCVELTPESIKNMPWLPDTCAYKLLYHGEPLPDWHPLLVGHAGKMHKKGRSIMGRVVAENAVSEEELQERVVHWV